MLNSGYGAASALTSGAMNAKSSSNSSSSSNSGYRPDSRSSQGLTRVGRTQNDSGLDRSATLNLAARAMKLKIKTKGLEGAVRQREVSERRQVGDAEGVVNPADFTKQEKPWWRNVTMEEGV